LIDLHLPIPLSDIGVFPISSNEALLLGGVGETKEVN
jgi:hypothetical protein